MTEDEDVILRESPLDQYLRDVVDRPFSKYGLEERRASHTESKIKDLCSVKRLFSFVQPSREVLEAALLLCNSPMLTESDAQLLLGVKEHLFEEFHCPKNKVKRTSSYLLLSLFLLLAAISIANTSLIFSVLAMGVALYIPINECIVYQFKRITLVVCGLKDVFEGFNKTVDACVVHIKEVELINGGKVCLNISFHRPHNCLKLRKRLLSTTSNLCRLVHHIQSCILCSDVTSSPLNFKEEYIALLPLQTFQDILQNDDKDFVELFQIKHVIMLFRMLLSELIYSIVQLFHKIHTEKKNSISFLYFLHHLYSYLGNLMTDAKVISQSNEEYLQASRKVVFRKDASGPLKCDKLKTSVDALHCTEVNLLTALNCVEQLRSMKDVTPNAREEWHSKIFLNFLLAIENAKSLMEDVCVYSTELDPAKRKPTETFTWRDKAEERIVMFEQPKDLGDVLYEGESALAEKSLRYEIDGSDLQAAMKERRESKRMMRELKCILSAKEKPEGLLPFPLLKPKNISSDSEDDCVAKKPSKSKYSYDNCTPSVSFQLPVPSTKIREEIFGSSDDDSSDAT